MLACSSCRKQSEVQCNSCNGKFFCTQCKINHIYLHQSQNTKCLLEAASAALPIELLNELKSKINKNRDIIEKQSQDIAKEALVSINQIKKIVSSSYQKLERINSEYTRILKLKRFQAQDLMIVQEIVGKKQLFVYPQFSSVEGNLVACQQEMPAFILKILQNNQPTSEISVGAQPMNNFRESMSKYSNTSGGIQPNMMQGHMQVGMSESIHRNTPGFMQGNMPGPMQGNMLGPMQGNMPGPMQGNMPGPMQGNMLGPMQGNMPGPMQGMRPNTSINNQRIPYASSNSMTGNIQNTPLKNVGMPGGIPFGAQGSIPLGAQGSIPLGAQGSIPVGTVNSMQGFTPANTSRIMSGSLQGSMIGNRAPNSLTNFQGYTSRDISGKTMMQMSGTTSMMSTTERIYEWTFISDYSGLIKLENIHCKMIEEAFLKRLPSTKFLHEQTEYIITFGSPHYVKESENAQYFSIAKRLDNSFPSKYEDKDVKWYYRKNDGNFYEYSAEISRLIENAYLNDIQYVIIQGQDSNCYRIHLRIQNNFYQSDLRGNNKILVKRGHI
ncbi:hypothetical protein SteCoe_27419 [Stentor coeruleus]|uniref:WWE domain-containing protein n=1 Tax=Stentor coeruleus TaxID=5963 RepID=A0A1R2BAL2_9CILI|nr:hypothetical protein SteCoe_27419 [Stentor coeruleus]